MVMANTPMSDAKSAATHGRQLSLKCAALRDELIATGKDLVAWQPVFDRSLADLGGTALPEDTERPADPPVVEAKDYAE
jgi:hypothetical protein